MRTWYSFSAKKEADGTEVADLSIFDAIGYYGVSAKDFVRDLAASTATKVTLSINSPGGDVFEAIGIYNALRQSGKEITVKVLGIAASAASYIMLAGDKITMPSNAMVMVHNASTYSYGNADELSDTVDILRKVDANLQATYASRTGMSAEKVVELLSKDTYLTAAECLELGLCDEVTEAVKMTAEYEVDRLPENVRALFEAAKPAASAAADTGRPTAAQITALATAAGVADFAETFTGDASLATIEAVTAAVAAGAEIVALCATAGMTDQAGDLIKTRLAPAAVGAKLIELRAAADQALHIDTASKQDAATTTAPKAKVVTTGGIWSKRKSITR